MNIHGNLYTSWGNKSEQLISIEFQYLGTCLGTVHDRVTSVNAERILESLESFCSILIPRIDHPSIRLHENGGAEIFVGVPPV